MSAQSYLDVFEVTDEHAGDVIIGPGDLVRTSENFFPHFRVIAIHNDKAWVRNVQTGADGLTALSRCRKLVDPSAG